MVFYEGAVTLDNLNNMPIPDLIGLLEDAEEIAKARQQ